MSLSKTSQKFSRTNAQTMAVAVSAPQPTASISPSPVPPLASVEYTKKLRIIRTAQELNNAVLQSGIPTDTKTCLSGYQALCAQFALQFPPLAAATAASSSTASSPPSSRTLRSSKQQIQQQLTQQQQSQQQQPQTSQQQPQTSQQQPQSQQHSTQELSGSGADSTKITSSSLKRYKSDIHLPTWRDINESAAEASAGPSSEGRYFRGLSKEKQKLDFYENSFCISSTCNKNQARKKLSSEDVAEILLEDIAANSAPRPCYKRPNYYVRHSPSDSGLSLSLFGVAEYSYLPTIEDYTFLVEWIVKTCLLVNTTPSYNFLRFLLSQSVAERNRFAVGKKSNLSATATAGGRGGAELSSPSSLKLNKFALNLNEGREFLKLSDKLLCRKQHQPTAVLASSTNKVPATIQMLRSDLSSYSPAPKSSSIGRSRAYALRNMTNAEITEYKKFMGIFITDEIFLFLINLFERLTGTKETVALDVAFEEARGQLGCLCPPLSAVIAVHEHWKARRQVLKKPLLRHYWAVPSSNDCNPFAVFRARTQEKMVLRRPRRTSVESLQRTEMLHREFIATDLLFSAAQTRDWLKIMLCDIDSLLFEQLWKEAVDPGYAHPLWPCIRGIIFAKIRTLQQIHETLLPKEKDNQTLTSRLKEEPSCLQYRVPCDFFNNGSVVLSDTQSSQSSSVSHSAKRRCLDTTTLGNGKNNVYPHASLASSLPAYYLGRKRLETGVSMAASSGSSTSPISKSKTFVSPVPLPPMYMEDSTAAATLDNPSQVFEIGVIDKSQKKCSVLSDDESYESYKPAVNNHPFCSYLNRLNTFLPSPVPSFSNFLCSPFGFLGLLDAQSMLRKVMASSNSNFFTNDYNEDSWRQQHQQLLPDSLQRPLHHAFPIYTQALNSLPEASRHPGNRRFIVPFGKRTSCTATTPADTDWTSLRVCLRIGRGRNRFWVDRSRFYVPPAHKTSVAVCLNDARRSSWFDHYHKEQYPEFRTITKENEANVLSEVEEAFASSVSTVALEEYSCEIKHGHVLITKKNISKAEELTAGLSSEHKCAFTGTCTSDYDIGFTSPLGMDSFADSGYFGFFCLPRHAIQRLQELAKEPTKICPIA